MLGHGTRQAVSKPKRIEVFKGSGLEEKWGGSSNANKGSRSKSSESASSAKDREPLPFVLAISCGAYHTAIICRERSQAQQYVCIPTPSSSSMYSSNGDQGLMNESYWPVGALYTFGQVLSTVMLADLIAVLNCVLICLDICLAICLDYCFDGRTVRLISLLINHHDNIRQLQHRVKQDS